MVEIDGSRGEGGGQILRTALALAIITKQPLRMYHIRAGRERPGLQRQHLACVEAAAKLCGAATKHDGIGSMSLDFAPSDAWASELVVDIGSAGSTSLVVQTILVPAIASARALRATITGGTHNPLAPPFDFIDRVFVPQLRAMGADVTLALERHGMMPQGEGRVVLDVRPSGPLKPIALVESGPIVARRAIAIVARLPRHVAERELAVAREELDDPQCELRELDDCGPHNVFMVEVERASGARELVTSQGRKGYPAEHVAEDAIDDIADYIEDDVPVGIQLADQLLLPLAVARGGRFRAIAPLSPHAVTNLGTIREFISKTELPIRSEPHGDAVEVIFG
jgi:RNA 3'-terminal phosphate cyclase (ATP)